MRIFPVTKLGEVVLFLAVVGIIVLPVFLLFIKISW